MSEAFIGSWLLTDGISIFISVLQNWLINRENLSATNRQTNRQTNSNFIYIDYQLNISVTDRQMDNLWDRLMLDEDDA